MNNCPEPHLIFAYLFLMKKVNLDIIFASKRIQCNIKFLGSMSEPFSKIYLMSDE